MTVETRPLSYALGAEVVGIDLNRPLSESEFGGIYRAFLDHGVLLLRGQIGVCECANPPSPTLGLVACDAADETPGWVSRAVRIYILLD